MNNSPVKVWRRQKTTRNLLGKRGIVISWTTIFTPPPQYKHIAPYHVVLVRLDDGSKITAQLVDSFGSEIQAKQRVIVVLRKLRENAPEDIIPYTIACKII